MKSSRREFIKKAGLAGIAAMTMAPQIFLAFASWESTKMSSKNNGLTILFQGNSITDGNRSHNNAWNHVMGHGYAYFIVSRLWYDYPDEHLMFYNRGVSGDKVTDLEKRWKQDTLDLKPDVLSILVGVNDLSDIIDHKTGCTIETYEKVYNTILERTKSALADCFLIFCEPFILPVCWGKDNIGVWQAEVLKTQKIVRKLANSFDAVFIELQRPFNKACQKAPADYWIRDGIHPMLAGHELISRVWIDEVGKKLPIIKS